MIYDFERYETIPPGLAELVCNVADIDNITNLPISDVNEFLNQLDIWYQANGLSLKDFE